MLVCLITTRDAQAEQLITVDNAMQKLSLLDERLVRVVELRFFAGLEVADIAELQNARLKPRFSVLAATAGGMLKRA